MFSSLDNLFNLSSNIIHKKICHNKVINNLYNNLYNHRFNNHSSLCKICNNKCDNQFKTIDSLLNNQNNLFNHKKLKDNRIHEIQIFNKFR